MIYARQSTAIIVTVGPVLAADGVAVTDGVVADFKISKNGAAPAGLNASATLTHRNTGHYSLSLTATDVNTVGTVEVVIDDTVNACPIKEIQVVEPTTYDVLFADAAPGPASPTNITAGTITTVTTTTTATNLTNAPTSGDFTATMKTSMGTAVAASAVASVTGNVGGNVSGSVGSVVGAVGSVTGAVGSVTGLTASDVGAIKAKTDNLPSDPADASIVAAATDAILTAVGDVPTNAELATALGTADDAVLAQVALVKAKTDQLTFTVAGHVDVNLLKVNGVTITGDGGGTPFNV